MMDAFEQIVVGLFRAKGYWTINGYRVELKREEKVEIGKPSLPRPELDILAYKASENELLWIECKSYLDSGGVRFNSFINEDDPGYLRFKMFNLTKYREVISAALIRQTCETGLTRENPSLRYCLVSGHTFSKEERKKIAEYFTQNGWFFYDEKWVTEELEKYSNTAYEDDVVMIVSKIIMRSLEKEK